MLKIIQRSTAPKGIRAVTGTMFSTTSKAASTTPPSTTLPEVPTRHSMKELSQGAKYGMIPTRGRYATFIIGEQKRVLHWKWNNPDGFMHEFVGKEYRLMYSMVVLLMFLTAVEYFVQTWKKTNAIKYNSK
ncbi:uncharacterized protein LOC132552630 [Ylistrum balloti]|uniref:uncharacterized protein LOC132552630 n=1 Tax=Ylistrum balloti TaxID=509963 RepID=UPI002905BA91|nr:uncharacterized protein LOC132552630 [Ylistrum balloti]